MKLLKWIFPLLFVLIILIVTTTIAYAVVKVNVCHHTQSPINPYVLVVVSVQSIEDAINLGGHGQHEDDAWHPYEFEGVIYPGRNEDVFGSLIDDSCNLIVPPTNTATSTNTSTPTATSTSTSTQTATSTSTQTATSTNTPTMTNTAPSPTISPPTPTNTPTSTQPTATPTEPKKTPTETPIIVPTSTNTQIPSPTDTPYPPKPAEANIAAEQYPSIKIGKLIMRGEDYSLYLGINAEDGSLLLPETEKGGALYLRTVWIHRAWSSGWLNLRVGDTIYFYSLDGKEEMYKIVDTSIIDYNIYPKVTNKENKFQYIATCYSSDNKIWTDVMLFHLEETDNK